MVTYTFLTYADAVGWFLVETAHTRHNLGVVQSRKQTIGFRLEYKTHKTDNNRRVGIFFHSSPFLAISNRRNNKGHKGFLL